MTLVPPPAKTSSDLPADGASVAAQKGDGRQVTISDRRSLAAARGVTDAARVIVHTERLKYRRLLPCAVKYAFWATRVGGEIVVKDDGGKDAAPGPYAVSFNVVRQWTMKFIGAGCEVVSVGAHDIVLRRTAAKLAPGWSAGVVFSGRDSEIPALLACLEGLEAQSELDRANGGEIVVCGPQRDLAFLSAHPHVRYLDYETPAGPRFLIGRKKNALMAALTNPRMVILHARMVLDKGALARVPSEFDISGPNTRVRTARGEEPYIALLQTEGVWPGEQTRAMTLGLRDMPSGDPLALMERGGVFVDGGAFYLTRPVFEACPLHPEIAWEEGEDVEWCGRAFACGFLVDIAPDSGALSQTNKLRDWSKLGPLATPLRLAVTWAKTWRAGINDGFKKAQGRR